MEKHNKIVSGIILEIGPLSLPTVKVRQVHVKLSQKKYDMTYKEIKKTYRNLSRYFTQESTCFNFIRKGPGQHEVELKEDWKRTLTLDSTTLKETRKGHTKRGGAKIRSKLNDKKKSMDLVGEKKRDAKWKSYREKKKVQRKGREITRKSQQRRQERITRPGRSVATKKARASKMQASRPRKVRATKKSQNSDNDFINALKGVKIDIGHYLQSTSTGSSESAKAEKRYKNLMGRYQGSVTDMKQHTGIKKCPNPSCTNRDNVVADNKSFTCGKCKNNTWWKCDTCKIRFCRTCNYVFGGFGLYISEYV